jgi:hypothetical protein
MDGDGSRSSRFTLGKERPYPLDRLLSGFHSLSGLFEEEKNILPLPGFEPQIAPHVDYAVLAVSNYSALLYVGSIF